ncbi:MAG TPA: twin-arginine translocase TatA/TatE family subunit, partial [Thermoanaerobaculia bacterium]|nr:twin-arginine translocase TatA/TatE family subunit [Thermoanaerobaculia bacterium]
MPNLGLPELLVILVIVVLIFGAGKIPQLGKG